MEGLIIHDLSKICRVCLSENDHMFSIYSEVYEEHTQEEIPCVYEILTNVLSLKVKCD